MDIASASEISVNFYQTARCHIREDGNVDRYRLEDVKFITNGLRDWRRLCITHTSFSYYTTVVFSGPSIIHTLYSYIHTYVLVHVEIHMSFDVLQLLTPSVIIFKHMSLFPLKYNCLLMSFSY